MKNLFIIFLFFSTVAQAEIKTLDIAYEMNSFKAEYSEVSLTGIIRVSGCDMCTKDIYNFDNNIDIKKNGRAINLKTFLTDSWNAKYPTIFLDKNSLRVVRVIY